MEIFIRTVEEMILSKRRKVTLQFPYTKGEIVSNLHRKYHFEEEYLEDGVRVCATIDEEDYGRYREFIVDDDRQTDEE